MNLVKETTSQIHIARQPIFHRDLSVYAYELLFRDTSENEANIGSNVTDADVASSKVMLNAVMEFSFHNLLDGKKGFCNLSHDFLLAGTELPISSDHFGIDILKLREADPETLRTLEQLSVLGFELALDDFEQQPINEELLERVDIVKISIDRHRRDELESLLAKIRDFPAKALAKRVENSDQFQLCKELGFDLFQGFFLCKPKTLTTRRLPESRLNVLRLLSALQDPDATPESIEEIIKNDVTLNYRLLRTVNSAYYGLSIKIRSISHAIVYLGLPAIRSWANLLALSGLEDRPNELIRQALTRAKACELMTAAWPRETREMAFTVGLFSMLDALMDQPMEALLQELPLEDDLVAALSELEGPYGRLLSAVLDYEQSRWEFPQHGMFSEEQLRNSYLQALEWAGQQYKALGA